MSLSTTILQEALHKQTAKDLIRDKIISLITSGILQVGDELPSERELASILMVSRETVRSAIQRLAGEGVVQVSHGARTRVSKLSSEISTKRIGMTNPTSINGYDLESVHAARLLVETAVVADATQRLSEDEVGRLERCVDAQRLCLNDPMRFLICDREFHLIFYYGSGNRLLADFVVDLYTFMLDHRRIAMSKPGAIEKSLEDHQFILDALRRRNPDAVAAAFSEHIRRIRDSSLALNEEGDGLSAPLPNSRTEGVAAAPDELLRRHTAVPL